MTYLYYKFDGRNKYRKSLSMMMQIIIVQSVNYNLVNTFYLKKLSIETHLDK